MHGDLREMRAKFMRFLANAFCAFCARNLEHGARAAVARSLSDEFFDGRCLRSNFSLRGGVFALRKLCASATLPLLAL